jgi:hypothetical protein
MWRSLIEVWLKGQLEEAQLSIILSMKRGGTLNETSERVLGSGTGSDYLYCGEQCPIATLLTLLQARLIIQIVTN